MVKEDNENPLLQVKAISFSYGQRKVLQDISFRAEAGEVIALLGPNGVGKSTLIKLLSGALSPSGGEISLFGRSLSSLSRREAAKEISVVPQEAPATFSFSVLEVVLMGRFPHQVGLAFAQEEDLRLARSALKEVGALQDEGRLVSALSGGERQRVMLARALAQDPKLLLLDEPTAHLDLAHQAQALQAVEARRPKSAIIAALHDLNLASLYATRLLLLSQGTILADGPPKEIMKSDLLERCFGHPVEVLAHPRYQTPAVLPRKL